MSGRIIQMRQKLRAGLEKLKPEKDWSFITTQIGMFAYTGLTAEQVTSSDIAFRPLRQLLPDRIRCEQVGRLASEYNIFMLKSGRISVRVILSIFVMACCSLANPESLSLDGWGLGHHGAVPGGVHCGGGLNLSASTRIKPPSRVASSAGYRQKTSPVRLRSRRPWQNRQHCAPLVRRPISVCQPRFASCVSDTPAKVSHCVTQPVAHRLTSSFLPSTPGLLHMNRHDR